MESGLPGCIEGEDEMTALTELLELVVDTAEKNCDLDTEITLEELPAEGGIYAELGEGFTESTYYNQNRVKVIPILFLCRHADQKRGLEELCSITDYLEHLRVYPQGKMVSWLDASTVKEPSRIGRDEDGVYHFSCIINCKIYY